MLKFFRNEYKSKKSRQVKKKKLQIECEKMNVASCLHWESNTIIKINKL